MSLSSIDLFGKGICRPHNNLERRRLREDVSFATYTGEIFLEVVVIVETGGFSIVIGTDEQIAGFAGVRPAREERGVVPHRRSPEGLIPGARKKKSGWHSPAAEGLILPPL